jgi:hypothetical protein
MWCRRQRREADGTGARSGIIMDLAKSCLPSNGMVKLRRADALNWTEQQGLMTMLAVIQLYRPRRPVPICHTQARSFTPTATNSSPPSIHRPFISNTNTAIMTGNCDSLRPLYRPNLFRVTHLDLADHRLTLSTSVFADGPLDLLLRLSRTLAHIYRLLVAFMAFKRTEAFINGAKQSSRSAQCLAHNDHDFATIARLCDAF